ncbi:MAG TPA: V-type ATP synthase subunit D [Anaerohalosphaeraceae bacterium]|nr:V-type ATP synthase subunit D [Anaerohalosphaeraceae bacterium]HOL32270.1 V-type ATP synthase subunit D [Anaerohalosphaeraceae bacterium]HPC65440.1 V-type ATP synthase subunit D [Anaerohalosphaeraceae bacterium]HRS72590.1 V-type ATP synthase subunit D [Anaerohalosphaeraceae bacterium]HRV21103.1 V-type ATP synthase subunit D [Anaerohalosphaeraceae bacterium]
MIQNVNATRMELLALRKRVALALRGHRLLSEKRDEICRQLVQIARDLRDLRSRVERDLLETSRRFMMARAVMEPEHIRAALDVPSKTFKLAVSFASIMSVQVPRLAKEIAGDILCYGFSSTSGELDAALRALERAFDGLIELAEKEKQCQLLAAELQSTRRRVNVLEHVVIPETKETIKYIYDKLGEAERDNISRLMKIADIIRR